MVAVLPAPLPVIPADFPIILEVTGGTADTRVAHLPMPVRTIAGGRSNGLKMVWDEFVDPPARWSSACGLVDGWVYNRAGCLAGVPLCFACELEVGGVPA